MKIKMLLVVAMAIASITVSFSKEKPTPPPPQDEIAAYVKAAELDVKVYAVSMPLSMKTFLQQQGYTLGAMTVKQNTDKVYIIYIDSSQIAKEDFISVISHELVHIRQYEQGLLIKNNNEMYWKNHKVAPHLDYKDRPYEIDAFNNQWQMEKKIRLQLKN